MLLTNFSKKDELKYRMAVKEYGCDMIYVDRNAYDYHGHKLEDCSALRYNGTSDKILNEFWQVYENIKIAWVISKGSGDDVTYLVCRAGHTYVWADKNNFIKLVIEKNNNKPLTERYLTLFESRELAIKYLKSLNIKLKCRVVPFNINQKVTYKAD